MHFSTHCQYGDLGNIYQRFYGTIAFVFRELECLIKVKKDAFKHNKLDIKLNLVQKIVCTEVNIFCAVDC